MLLALLGWAGTVLPAYAQQKQAAWWCFGDEASLNFNASPPRYAPRVNALMQESAAISDAQGRLLFYTDGDSFFDRTQMPIRQVPATGGPRQVLIAQQRLNPARYYVFAIETTSTIRGLSLGYFQVDMSLRGGLGDVLPGYTTLRYRLMDRLSLLQHANGRDSWLLTCNGTRDSLLFHRLDSLGVRFSHASRSGVRFRSKNNLYSSAKSSPNSEWLAVTDSVAGVRLFAFNRATGIPTYRYTLQIPVSFGASSGALYTVSCAFSADNTKLYVGQLDQRRSVPQPPLRPAMYQFDLNQPDSVAIQASRSFIADFPGAFGVLDMQLGIDAKLYINTNDTTLARLDCPNVAGAGCGFRPKAVRAAPPGLGSTAGGHLPSLNQTLFVNANLFQVQASDTLVCAGDTVTLAAYGGGADTFRWAVAVGSTAAVPAPESSPRVVPPVGLTTYTVAGTGPCTSHVGQVTVRVQPRPTVALALMGLPPRLCVQGGPVALAGGTPAGGTYSGRGVTNGVLDSLVAGVGADTITYSYTAPNGCDASARQIVTVDACLGLAATGAAPNLLVWPNPALGAVTVRAGAAGSVRLLDALGRAVRVTPAAAGQDVRWDVADLPAGLYLVLCND